jgi:VanZ family protein
MTLGPLSGDRATDSTHGHDGRAKPPVLSRAALRKLALLCLAVILYGTLGPLGLDHHGWIDTTRPWSWSLPAADTPRDDALTNFFIYLPVGVALRLLCRRRGCAGWRDLLAGAALSVALSYGTELAQQFMPARVASRADFWINSLAAVCGCLIAVHAQRALRHLHTRSFALLHSPGGAWRLLAAIALGIAVLVMTAPWDLKRPKIELGIRVNRAEDSPALTAARDTGSAMLARAAGFAILGFCLSAGQLVRRGCCGEAYRRAVLYVAACALTLELVQMGLAGHVCSVWHALAQTTGGLGGVLLAALVVHAAQSRGGAPILRQTALGSTAHVRRLAAGVLVVVALYAVLAGMLTAGPPGTLRAEPLIYWTPLAREFLAPLPQIIASLGERLAVFGLLTFACLILARQRGAVLALVLLGALVLMREIGRAFAGPGASTTTPLLAGLAWYVAVRIWSSVQPRPSLAPPAWVSEARLGAGGPGLE